jgi:hypothetical protein
MGDPVIRAPGSICYLLRIGDSNSKNAVRFSSARTTKRFPLRGAPASCCRPWFNPYRRRFLKQAEEFEDDNDNDNHANDVKNVSVHVGDSYQSECAVASQQLQLSIRFAERNRALDSPFGLRMRISPERKQARFCA